MSKKTINPYVILVIALLCGFLLFSAWSARQAGTKGSQISDPAYYSHGLKYTNTQVEKQSAVSQGWALETQVSQHQLSFRLYGKQNQPISQAAGELTLYLSQENKVLRLKPHEKSPGFYQLSLPANLKGSLQARIEFTLRKALISRRLLITL